jgi:hypothetical protein
MALRDWRGWQIGVLWAVGIGITWLVGRLGVAAVDSAPAPDSAAIAAGAAPPPISAGGAPLWTTAVTVLILALLLFITARWIRGQIFDA